MKIAFVDIGTNTILLLIAELSLASQSYKILYEDSEIIRLGEGLEKTLNFSEAACERALKATQKFKNIANDYSCTEIHLAATAAFRMAQNAKNLQDKILNDFGLKIEIISGEKEAKLIALANGADFIKESYPQLILDIGGGSTEFILMKADNQSEVFSLPFGVVKLTEKFFSSQTQTDSEIQNLQNFIKNDIHSVQKSFSQKPQTLIATAGTPTTLSAILQNLNHYDAKKVHQSQFTFEQLQNLRILLQNQTQTEREKIPVLPAKRADVIVAGCVILESVMAAFQFLSLKVSDKGLRHGLLESYLLTASFKN